MRIRALTIATCLSATVLSSLAEAQTQRAAERRIDRNQRQIQRQANRADYYSDQTWQEINPWIQQYGINPITRAAGAARSTAGAAAEATRAAANTAAGAARGAANVVANSADAADGRIDGRFGYVDRNNQGWFYDYYTYTPTYYYGTDNAERYAGAIRYFDADNDGVYESSAYYRDSNEDGSYDEYDRVDFYSVEEVESQPATATTERRTTSTYVGPSDSRRYQVEGEIAMVKTAKVNGNEHLVVALAQSSEAELAIDLGPAKAMQDRDVEVGKAITAIGAVEQVGERRLLVADRVRLGSGQTIEIDRTHGLTLTGSIVDVKETRIGTTTNYMAVVNVDGERQLVDLGPVNSYKVKLQPSTEVVIHGLPVRSRDHRVIMANRVRLGSEVIEVNRAQSFSF